MSLAQSINDAIGQPATVRIGVVTAVEPLIINIQGTLFTDVGVLSNYSPVVGETVAVLGQSAVSSDGSSWLCLGHLASSATLGLSTIPVRFQALDLFATASAAFTTAGGIVCGVAFTAPLTGRIQLNWNAEILSGAASFTLVSPQIALGSVVGAGTPVVPASDNRTVRNDNTLFIRAGSSDLITGLTPGIVYNVALYFRVGAAAGTISRREVSVYPV